MPEQGANLAEVIIHGSQWPCIALPCHASPNPLRGSLSPRSWHGNDHGSLTNNSSNKGPFTLPHPSFSTTQSAHTRIVTCSVDHTLPNPASLRRQRNQKWPFSAARGVHMLRYTQNSLNLLSEPIQSLNSEDFGPAQFLPPSAGSGRLAAYEVNFIPP